MSRVRLYVDGMIFEGWKTMSLTKDLFSIADQFSISMTDKWQHGAPDWRLHKGQKVKVKLDEEFVFSGFINSLDISLKDRSVSVSGRSRAGDLIDCSILGDLQHKNQKLEIFLNKICSPFGIKVIPKVSTGGIIPSIVVQSSESVFDVMDRLTRAKGLLLRSNAEGDIEIISKGLFRSPDALVEGINLLDASLSDNETDRFSEIIVKSQSKETVNIEAKAKDLAIERYRPKILISESSQDQAGAEKRAQWETSFRAAKSQGISCQVFGWRRSDGSLWSVNETVEFDCPFMGLKTDLIIKTVTFDKSDSTLTSLELMREDAFEKTKEKKKKDDLVSRIKWKTSSKV